MIVCIQERIFLIEGNYIAYCCFCTIWR